MPELHPIPETKAKNGGVTPPSAPPPIFPTTSIGTRPQQPSSSRDRTFGIPPPPPPGPLGTPPPSSRDRSFGPRKTPQEYNGRRDSRRRRKSSSCCCRCFLWSTLIIIVLILLFGASIGVFFAIYHPKDTKFSVSEIRLSKFELNSNDQLLTSFTLNISTRNPSNSRFHYTYDNVSVSIFSHDDIFIGDGQFPAYEHAGGETLTLSAKIQNDGNVLDAAKAESFRKKAILNTVIEMDTKAGLKADSLKINYVRIRVACKDVMIPTGRKLPDTVNPIEATCKTKIKFWKWFI